MPDRTLPLPDTQITKVPEIQTTQADKLAIRVAASATDLTQDAASMATDYLQALLEQQATVRVILATGNSQLRFLEAIADCKRIDWSRIILFHLDEYLGIAAEHPGSFRYYLRQRVEQRVSPRAFHYIEGDASQPLSECDRYSNLLQQQAIDLCLLGIGDNGHLAFNEPSVADFNDPQLVNLVKLETKTRQQQVDGGYFPELSAVPIYAYTLTIPTICKAKKILCLAGGKHKAEVVQQTITLSVSPSFPATILRTLPQATLFCDRDSFNVQE